MSSMYDRPICGTVRAYLAHLHKGETPCTWCADVWAIFSATTPGNGYHQRHIAAPDAPATQTCARCWRDLGPDDYSVRQWQAPGGVCKDCTAQAAKAGVAS